MYEKKYERSRLLNFSFRWILISVCGRTCKKNAENNWLDFFLFNAKSYLPSACM